MKKEQIIDGVNEKAMFNSVQGVIDLDDNEVLENVTETEVPESVIEKEIIADANKQAMQESVKAIEEDDLNNDDLPEVIEQASDNESLELNKEQTNDDVDDISDSAKKAYKKLSDDSEGVGILRKAKAFIQAKRDYFNENNVKKANLLHGHNLQETGKYEMPLNEKGLKALKKSVEQAKKTMQLFDKIHEIVKKYAIWAVCACLLFPFAIPAALSIIGIVGAETIIHETMAQHTYRRVVKPLENNGRNKYKNMYYTKGYKELDKLVAPEVQAKDIAKLITDMNSPDKEVAKKASEDMKKLVDKNKEAMKEEINEKDKEPKEMKNEKVKPIEIKDNKAKLVADDLLPKDFSKVGEGDANYGVFANEKDIDLFDMATNKKKMCDNQNNQIHLLPPARVKQSPTSKTTENENKVSVDKESQAIIPIERSLAVSNKALTNKATDVEK